MGSGENAIQKVYTFIYWDWDKQTKFSLGYCKSQHVTAEFIAFQNDEFASRKSLMKSHIDSTQKPDITA